MPCPSQMMSIRHVSVPLVESVLRTVGRLETVGAWVQVWKGVVEAREWEGEVGVREWKGVRFVLLHRCRTPVVVLRFLSVVPRPQLLDFQHSIVETPLAHPGVQLVSS